MATARAATIQVIRRVRSLSVSVESRAVMTGFRSDEVEEELLERGGLVAAAISSARGPVGRPAGRGG